MRCCSLFREIDEIIELFYACTQLSIAALTPEGDHTCPHCKPRHLERLRTKFQETTQGEVHLSDSKHDAAYYVLPICPCAKKPGVFIIGPYSNNKEVDSPFSYRSEEAWEHLIPFLRSLQGVEAVTPAACSGQNKPHCLPVHRAKTIVRQHYDEQISLKQTAKYLGLNKSYLSTLFREETGQTFTEFVNEVRIEQSIKLLQDTSDSILDIALQVGFSNQNYFSRIFKKLTGNTPSEFRQLSLAQFD